jgi:hypothetical protein
MSDWHDSLDDAQRVHQAGDYARAAQLARKSLDELIAARGWDAARHMSRLLANAVYRQINMRSYKCPRCEVEVLNWAEGEDSPRGAVLSRTSRSEDDAPIHICARCGEREDISAWRTGASVPAPRDWPLSIDQLLAEDRTLYESYRSSELKRVDLDELDPGEEEGG